MHHSEPEGDTRQQAPDFGAVHLGRRGFLAGAGALVGLGVTAGPVAAATGPGTAAGSGTAALPGTATAQWRPLTRFTPRRNWMNDPNGLVYYQGEYHLFFQHNPKGIEHANLSWGHAVSTDLVDWQELSVALRPDELGEIFSGSAVVDHSDVTGFFDGGSGLVAFYTSAGDTQQQSIAHSRDRGRTWTKYRGNPVIENPGIEDFRDPKVIWHAPSGKWVLLVAAGDRILFYDSSDLIHWRRISEFGVGQGAHGGVWECPDLFELPVDGDPGRSRWVFIVSINPGGPAGGSGTQYFLGDFDGTTFTNDNPADEVRWVERGADFYAPQSWSNITDGRRLWVGWMSNWNYASKVPTHPWRGTMTVPRQVGLTETAEGVRISQQPVDELRRARTNRRRWSGEVAGRGGGAEFHGRALDVVAEFRLDGSVERAAALFGFDVFDGAGVRTRIGYDVAAGKLFCDRTRAQRVEVSPGFPARHAARLSPDGDVVRMRILLDHCGVEVFGGRGQTVLSDLVFPGAESDGVRPFAEGGRVHLSSLEVYDLTVR